MTTEIRRLTPDDAAAWFALRREMLLDTPESFLASPSDDSASSVEVVRERLSQGADSAIVGAFEGAHLVGAIGVMREPREKTSHRIWIWGVYVQPQARGGGIAGRMLVAAIEHARSLPAALQLCLSVSADAPAALRVYERAGFRQWGREPRALLVDGRIHDELHLSLPLDE
ncbi:MAG: GNAT family N-acetyltransferase [Planctomycetota bacterium]|nr:GNAT family N-acetyltransferase [Planctomycetota bacterium]